MFLRCSADITSKGYEVRFWGQDRHDWQSAIFRVWTDNRHWAWSASGPLRHLTAAIGTAERVGTRERPRHGDLPLPDALGNGCDLRVIDAARDVVEDDIDGRTLLDGLKAILRKHSDNRNLVLDDELYRRARL